MTGRHARRTALGLAVGAALVATACSNGTNGKGTTAPGLTSPAAGSGSGSSGFPSTPASSGSSAGGGSCVSGAGYCDTFGDASTGWAVENKPHFFAGYDKYLGGTYRVGERTAATVSEPAPTDITKLAADYSVQVDVDAVLANTMPATSSFGISCWEHASSDGSSTAGFVFLVSATNTSIGLWSDTDGAYHEIVSQPTPPGALKTDGTPNHLTATCVQDRSSGSVQAQLGISVNGASAVTTTYAKSVKTHTWAVGTHAGLLASGLGSDIFYDNFALTAK